MIIQILIIVLAVLIVVSIMMQQGKGSDLGSALAAVALILYLDP